MDYNQSRLLNHACKKHLLSIFAEQFASTFCFSSIIHPFNLFIHFISKFFDVIIPRQSIQSMTRHLSGTATQEETDNSLGISTEGISVVLFFPAASNISINAFADCVEFGIEAKINDYNVTACQLVMEMNICHLFRTCIIASILSQADSTELKYSI